MTIATHEGGFDATGLRFGLVVGRFNDFIVDRLRGAAVDTLRRHGAREADMEEVLVPGAWELPMAARRLLRARELDGVIALGCVIRGGTPHFDYVAGECTKGLASVSMEEDRPVTFGVLTVDTIEQAIERAGTKAGNKGAEAAMAAIETANALRQLAPEGRG
ncbi:MAG: 6,7-dimethyl-8-ribityllumazine synthase [Pseudomonadota bacterium]|jgi:6,7-dimethyl-8-ribityllumazine synthase